MDFSHKLPAHLGGWPCRLLGHAATDGIPGVDESLVLVEYEYPCPQQDTVKVPRRIYVHADELTRIVPAEPSTPFVQGADGKVYRMLPGREPGTNERLWQKVHGAGPVMTWTVLTQTWADQDKGEPVVPLAPVQPVQLPFEITSSDSDRMGVDVGNPQTPQVRLQLAGNWTWCEPEEAEQVAWALLSAVWQVRGPKAPPAVTLVDGKRALNLCAECPTQAVCLADANCHHLQSYGHRAGEGEPLR